MAKDLATAWTPVLPLSISDFVSQIEMFKIIDDCRLSKMKVSIAHRDIKSRNILVKEILFKILSDFFSFWKLITWFSRYVHHGCSISQKFKAILEIIVGFF